jgi:hypothetical protein
MLWRCLKESIGGWNSVEYVERLFLHKVNPGIYLLKSNALVAKVSSLSTIHNFRFFILMGKIYELRKRS